MKKRHVIERIVFVLLILSGLDLGVLGLFGSDFIGAIFGQMSALSRVIYVIMGAAAVFRFIVWSKMKMKQSR